MSVYLVLVLLTMPASQGQAGATVELHREFITASSDSVCKVHAEKLAREHLQKQAATVQRLGGRVSGNCLRQGSMP